MPTFPRAGRWSTSSTWPRKTAGAASTALAAVVFAVLDVADVILCFAYALLDGVLEDSPVRCYCYRSYDDGIREAAAGASVDGGGHEEVSDTLYACGRRSTVRDALLGLVRRVVPRRTRAPPDETVAPCKWRSPRWSDCACKSCVAWRCGEEGGGRLHVVVREPAPEDAAAAGTTTRAPNPENAIFVHGFASSSSFWSETVFRESSCILDGCRLFAVDLLGFGRSPKPANCMYRVRDHVEAIERTLILAGDGESQSLMSSFHLVSHSMGCTIALALAAKHPTRVKSITLVAPPYFLPCEQRASQVALNRLAEKKLWPPLLFGSAVMSWYEHVGRTVCFLVCKNHLLWEWLFSLLNLNRGVDFRVRDLTKHTHHSAWHTMHNVICGGAALQDANLEAVAAAGIPVQVLHGADDQVVPVECGRHVKAKIPRAKLRVMDRRDHSTVVLGRERGFAEELRAFWWASRSPVHVQDAEVRRGRSGPASTEEH